MNNGLTLQDYIAHRNCIYHDYSKLTDVDLARLKQFLITELEASIKNDEVNTRSMQLLPEIEAKYNDDFTIAEAYFYVRSHYYERREAISFYRDGTIGLCGWADSKNVIPFYRAFERWLETVIDRLPVVRMEGGSNE